MIFPIKFIKNVKLISHEILQCLFACYTHLNILIQFITQSMKPMKLLPHSFIHAIFQLENK